MSDLPSRPSPVSESGRPVRFNPNTNAVLFLLTVFSVFFMAGGGEHPLFSKGWFFDSARFAVPLLLILLAHELGHYFAARLHHVPASLPYFLPLPLLSPFGTLGAVIVMPRRIRSARALLDIGAAGPLAGMVMALPFMIYGLSVSEVGPPPKTAYWMEGQSLLYSLVKYLVVGPIPAGYDVSLHPTAFAAWAGFLITFLNLLPYGQLDGGHVSFAVFGQRHTQVARWLPWVPVAMVVYNFWEHTWASLELQEGPRALYFLPWGALAGLAFWWRRRLAKGGKSPAEAPSAVPGDSQAPPQLERALTRWLPWMLVAATGYNLLTYTVKLNGSHAYAPAPWLTLLLLLLVLRRFAGGSGHPPVDDPRLGRGRRAVGLFTLSLFILLFMPSPLVQHDAVEEGPTLGASASAPVSSSTP